MYDLASITSANGAAMFTKRSGYDTDLTDDQWAIVRKFIPKAGTRGRPRTTNVREVIDAILYFTVNGVKWRNLPKEFSPWETVYGYFTLLRKKGKWAAIHYALYEKAREEAGRHKQPSMLMLDSQSVKTGKNAHSSTRGYDGGKRIKGRKRHVVTDSLGLIVDVAVTKANVHDTKGGMTVLDKIKARWKRHRVRKLVADKGYQGPAFMSYVRAKFGAAVEIGQNHTSPRTGFVPAKKRWVVERGFAWLGDYWRLSVDRERLLKNSTTMIRIAFMRLLLRRLFPVPSHRW